MLAVYFDYGSSSDLVAVFEGSDYPRTSIRKAMETWAQEERAQLVESVIEADDIVRRVEISEAVARF